MVKKGKKHLFQADVQLDLDSALVEVKKDLIESALDLSLDNA